VIILNSEAVYLANLFSGEYWLHGWMISAAKRHKKHKSGHGPPRLARRCINCSVFQDT
jgi:hypothetical protein